MKQILLIAIFFLNANSSETFLGMDKKEFQAKIFNSMIDGVTGAVGEAKDILLNPPDLSSQRKKDKIKNDCNRKYWDYQKASSKYWWNLFYENAEIRKKLTKRKINYSIILKQNVKDIILDVDKIRKESCSKSYFDLIIKRKKADYKITQENKILRDLARIHFISIKKQKDLYYQEPKQTRKHKKLDIVITNSKDMDEEMRKAMRDVD